MGKKINAKIFDFVMRKLQMNKKENLLKILNHSAPQKYGDKSIICVGVRVNNIMCCKQLIFILGDDDFLNQLFETDHFNVNCIEYAIKSSAMQTIEFLFGIKQICQKIRRDKDRLFRIVYWTFAKYNEQKFEYIVQQKLGLNDEIFRELLNYKSPKQESTTSRKTKTYWDQ